MGKFFGALALVLLVFMAGAAWAAFADGSCTDFKVYKEGGTEYYKNGNNVVFEATCDAGTYTVEARVIEIDNQATGSNEWQNLTYDGGTSKYLLTHPVSSGNTLADGSITAQFRACESGADCNCSTVTCDTTPTDTITLDNTAPATTDDYDGAWKNADVTVILTPTDTGSDVKSTNYQVDSGGYTTGTSITITTDGNHTVNYYSLDNLDNMEATKTKYVLLDKTACSQITNLDAYASSNTGKIDMTWSAPSCAVAGLSKFKLYRSNGAIDNGNKGSATVVNDNISSGSTSYQDTPPSTGTTYYYAITSFDVAGNESSVSNNDNAQASSGSSGATPGTPDIRGDSEHSDNAWSNDTSVTFSWDNVSNANWYGCNWGTSNSSEPSSGYSSCSSGYSQSGLSNNTTYYLWVKACASSNSNCSSADKFTVKIDTQRPEQVTGLTVKLTDGEPELDWDEPNDSGGSGIGNYRIYRSTKSGFDAEDSDEYQFDATESSTNYTDDSSLVNGRTYYYKVRAYDDAGNGSEEASAQKSITMGESSSSGNLRLNIEADEYVKGDTLEAKVTASGGRMWNAYLKVYLDNKWTVLVNGKDDISGMEGSMPIKDAYQGKSGYVYAVAEDEDGEIFDEQFNFVVDGKAPEASWETAPTWDEAGKKVVLSLKVDEEGSGTKAVTFFYQKGTEWVKIAEVTAPKNGVYSYNWNTAGLEGRYVIKAVVADNAGNSTETEPTSLMFKATVQQETAEQPTTPTGEGTGTTEQPSDMTGLIFVGGGLLAGLVVLLAIVAVWLVVSQGREDMGLNSELLRASDRAERGSFVRNMLSREPKKEPRKRPSGQGIFAYKE
ncbi:MAG: fibronectin type III domain-containing protein [Candidatus Diapherotrites archaeon]